MIAISLPWPPSANRYWRTYQGRMIISREAREYRTLVGNLVSKLSINKCLGRLEVVLATYPPDRRKRDLDNLLKVVFDSLQKAMVYEDDSQIDKITIQRFQVIKGGNIEVEINEI
ncbi:RusA family crossover junction endodeoxyribonuclease [Candidatus Odyssella acanthamoebae]|uniref:Crossover junction endodeoxyribonuclease RusA n=1 Tax=Candidatus Odyssella acanthamoebae TaxID=91604 RepID=A0A077AUA5_9PROT|nr:RusA family crossover junction endodeoxyribonuclease [Candidatus Paracaedibacter acanthamoebae]AIK95926.1 hypothetical protein ID47_03010 [Candidatus Paracaedibacter acanthamoebae]